MGKHKIDLKDREFLWKLKAEANYAADTAVNPKWNSIYRRLGEVLCELSTYVARIEEEKRNK